MGTIGEILSGTSGRNAGQTTEGAAEDIERDLLDRTERRSMAGPARTVRAMADGVQAIRGMAEKRPDRADIP